MARAKKKYPTRLIFCVIAWLLFNFPSVFIMISLHKFIWGTVIIFAVTLLLLYITIKDLKSEEKDETIAESQKYLPCEITSCVNGGRQQLL